MKYACYCLLVDEICLLYCLLANKICLLLFTSRWMCGARCAPSSSQLLWPLSSAPTWATPPASATASSHPIRPPFPTTTHRSRRFGRFRYCTVQSGFVNISVLWIRIRLDPELFPRSGSTQIWKTETFLLLAVCWFWFLFDIKAVSSNFLTCLK